MRKVIVNTTPIIALADIGYLDLLKKLYNEILIPEAVLSEIISEPAHMLVWQSDWIKVKKAPVQSQKNSFSTRLSPEPWGSCFGQKEKAILRR